MAFAEGLQVLGIEEEAAIAPMRNHMIHVGAEREDAGGETLDTKRMIGDPRIPDPAPRPAVRAFGKSIGEAPLGPVMRRTPAARDERRTARLETMLQRRRRHPQSPAIANRITAIVRIGHPGVTSEATARRSATIRITLRKVPSSIGILT